MAMGSLYLSSHHLGSRSMFHDRPSFFNPHSSATTSFPQSKSSHGQPNQPFPDGSGNKYFLAHSGFSSKYYGSGGEKLCRCCFLNCRNPSFEKKTPMCQDLRCNVSKDALEIEDWKNLARVKQRADSTVMELCQRGELKKAVEAITELLIEPSVTTYACLLNRCAEMKAFTEGKQVHRHIARGGLMSSIFLGNTLIDMYGKCGSMLDAWRVFDQMPRHNVSSWTMIISTYAKHGHSKEAIALFDQMQAEGLKPNEVIFVSILKACASFGSLTLGKQVHASIVASGLVINVFLGCALVDMYAKCGSIRYARKVFDRLHERNVVSWNALIAGYAQYGHVKPAFFLFERMRREGGSITPDEATFVSILKACATTEGLEQGKHVHALIEHYGLGGNVSVRNALINMYTKCGSLGDALREFGELQESRDTASWNSMIAGCVKHGHGKDALALFERMNEVENVKPDEITFLSALKACVDLPSLKQIHANISRNGFPISVVLGSTLVDMYAKCGSVEDAWHVFDRLHNRNVVSWNVMIAGYAQNGYGKEALALFDRMQVENVNPDEATFVNALKACTILGALECGRRVHTSVEKNGFGAQTCVMNVLIDMYAKCGNLEDAWQVLNKMWKRRSVVSWTALIGGYTQLGQAKEALALLKRMQKEGVEPNRATFSSVLSACNHAGLVAEGCLLFDSMTQNCGIAPSTEHYVCMVDMLGQRRGLAEAEEFIKNIPGNPPGGVWMALLGACRAHGNPKLARLAFERVRSLEPRNVEAYVLLLNIYASIGKWDDVAMLRNEMNNKGLKKKPGCSWVELNGEVHSFFAGDQKHPQIEKIRAELKRLIHLIKGAGYVPDLSLVVDDMDEEQKEDALCDHSEKLAIGFGMMNTPPRMTLRITKNLPVCSDWPVVILAEELVNYVWP